VGEEVKLNELLYQTKWSVLGGRGWDEEKVLLKVCHVVKCKYPFRMIIANIFNDFIRHKTSQSV
jgi:hypothetical protein